MEANEMLALLVGIAAGAWGAKLAGAEPWRGAVVVIVAFTAAIGATLAIGREMVLLSLGAAVVAAAVASGALGMRARQTSIALLGGWVAFGVALGIANSASG